MQLPADFQTVETRCGRESHTRPRGPSESPDGVDPNIRRTRKTQRDGHNSGVKIWSLCSVSSTLTHANPWTTLSSPCNKVRGEYFSKEVFLHLNPSCVFLRASVSIIESLWYGKWVYNICPIWCLCQQSSSRIQTEPGYRKRQFLSITTRHQRKGQRKMLELKDVKKINK